MLTVIETPLYLKYASSVFTEDERSDFADWIAENPDAGDVIPQTGGLRKVRWARSGMGKQSGARVIFYTRLQTGQIILVVAYAKAKFDNLPASVLKSWKETIDEYFK